MSLSNGAARGSGSAKAATLVIHYLALTPAALLDALALKVLQADFYRLRHQFDSSFRWLFELLRRGIGLGSCSGEGASDRRAACGRS